MRSRSRTASQFFPLIVEHRLYHHVWRVEAGGVDNDVSLSGYPVAYTGTSFLDMHACVTHDDALHNHDTEQLAPRPNTPSYYHVNDTAHMGARGRSRILSRIGDQSGQGAPWYMCHVRRVRKPCVVAQAYGCTERSRYEHLLRKLT